MVVGCHTAKSPNKSTHNNAYFKIQIEQDGRIISPFKNAVFLNKKPFKFNIEMKGVDGIYLSTTWDDKMYNFPKNKNIFFCDDEGKYEDCGFLSPQTMASENYNSDKLDFKLLSVRTVFCEESEVLTNLAEREI